MIWKFSDYLHFHIVYLVKTALNVLKKKWYYFITIKKFWSLGSIKSVMEFFRLSSFSHCLASTLVDAVWFVSTSTFRSSFFKDVWDLPRDSFCKRKSRNRNCHFFALFDRGLCQWGLAFSPLHVILWEFCFFVFWKYLIEKWRFFISVFCIPLFKLAASYL